MLVFDQRAQVHLIILQSHEVVVDILAASILFYP